MKEMKKIIIILIIFTIIMALIVVYFLFLNERIHIKNMSNDILKYSYTLDNGEYIYNMGVIYTKEGKVLNDSFLLNGKGKIVKDKYGNVKFYILNDKYCVNKNSFGKIKLSHESCIDFKEIESNILVNNTKVSFDVKEKNLSYLLSKNDDMNGNWISPEYKDSIIIDINDPGNYYIWFKNVLGVISEPIRFNINCFESDNSVYNKDTFYCPLATVIIDDEEWTVIDSDNDYVSLLKTYPLENKLSHCLNFKSDNICYYTKKKNVAYNWKNSYINQYLNKDFYDYFSLNIKNNIIDVDICVDDDSMCDSENCVGVLRSEIVKNNWVCNNYEKSFVRLLSYSEYENIYSQYDGVNYIFGNYWMINLFSDGYGTSMQRNGDMFVKEKLTNKLDIRPVITLSR